MHYGWVTLVDAMTTLDRIRASRISHLSTCALAINIEAMRQLLRPR